MRSTMRRRDGTDLSREGILFLLVFPIYIVAVEDLKLRS